MQVEEPSDEEAKTQLWFALAMGWAAFGFLAWLSAWLFGTEVISPSWATTMAILIVAASVQLRWPILSPAPPPAESACHLVWLLGWLANVNWIGYVWLRVESFPAALPPLALIAASEWWMLQRLPGERLAWLSRLRQSPPGGWRMLFDRSQASASDDTSDDTTPASPNAVSSDDDREHPTSMSAGEMPREGVVAESESLSDPNVRRSCVDGLDEHGRRFLAGDARIHFAAQQQSLPLVIGFCPAFAARPDVEMEPESDDLTWRIMHCTAAGVRIELRRPPSSQAAEYLLSWYAQVNDDQPATAERLP